MQKSQTTTATTTQTDKNKPSKIDGIINTYLSRLNSIRENAEFGSGLIDFKQFKQLVEEEKYGLAKKYLDENLKLISDQGSSRSVYRLSEDRVIKFVKNKIGFGQNKGEWEVLEQAPEHCKILFAKIYDHDKNFAYLVSEYGKGIQTEEEFEKVSGIPFIFLNTFDWKESWFNPEEVEGFMQEKTKLYKTNPLFRALIDVDKLNITNTSEFKIIQAQWGITNDGRAVVVDYGLTPEVYRNFYTGSRR